VARDVHDFVGFKVPRDMKPSHCARLSTRREACSNRRAVVERNSLTSTRSSSAVDLVRRQDSSCQTGAAKARLNKFKNGPIKERFRFRNQLHSACFWQDDREHDILGLLNF